jgi:hypothetical protein
VKEVNKRLLAQKNLPEFEPVPLTLASLVAEGMRLVTQQDLVNTNKLGEEYMVSRRVDWVIAIRGYKRDQKQSGGHLYVFWGGRGMGVSRDIEHA